MIIRLTATSILLAVATTVAFAAEPQSPNEASAQKSKVLVFGDIDSNHDMKITADEFKVKEKVAAKFKKADTNKDGTLDKDEFIAYANEEQ